MNLTINDYLSILDYYNIPITPRMNNKEIQKKAEEILVNKLCRCIKKIDVLSKKNKNESRAIAICSNSIIKNKKLKLYKFTCKKKPRLITNKKTKKKLQKI